jgi:hypothetical protein
MRKFLKFAGVFMAVTVCVMALTVESCYGDPSLDMQRKAEEVNRRVAAADDVPGVTFFLERETQGGWTRYWDKPNTLSYLYIVSYGQVLGYYVCMGKPVSTRSYLIPEYEYHLDYPPRQRPALDGTYGEDNPGIRFKTVAGNWCEWGGQGATYLFSSIPLNLKVPNLEPAAN